jgi:DNA (cytosine-5)-methyltransferase 1
VDILTGGFPCQDLSLAGKRAGLKTGTRSGLWHEFARAIEELQPSLVVIENVRGLLSAKAVNGMEYSQEDLDDWGGQPTFTAIQAVLGSLADIGYDAKWCGLRAADAGAPHNRFRVFIIAYPAYSEHDGTQGDKNS